MIRDVYIQRKDVDFFFIHTGKVIEKRKQSVLVSVYVSHEINQAQVEALLHKKRSGEKKKP